MNPVPVVRGPYRRVSGRKPRHNVRGVERRWRAGKLDGRRRETMQIEALADDFAEDAGGWVRLTNREVALIHVAAFAAWACQQAAAWAIQRRRIIDGDGSMPGVLSKNFIAYGNLLGRSLERLGLRPDHAEKLPSLDEYLAARTNGHAGAQPAPPARASDTMHADTTATPADAAAGAGRGEEGST